MQHLIKEVNVLVDDEYASAAQKFGCLNHSDHESYAVLLEEVEEAQDELSNVWTKIHEFWEMVRNNGSAQSKKTLLRALRISAVLTACECIQVAAMAYKAEQTIIHKGEHQ